MAKTPKKPKPEDIETVPDAWERFERAVDTVTRTPPKPKPKSPKSEPRKRKIPAK
jgi:hypothetical protein